MTRSTPATAIVQLLTVPRHPGPLSGEEDDDFDDSYSEKRAHLEMLEGKQLLPSDILEKAELTLG